MTELKIKVTKEVLERSKNCGTSLQENEDSESKNCAIALAVRDVFPRALVGSRTMYFDENHTLYIDLPQKAQIFISKFDALKHTPEKRIEMPEIEFSVQVPDSVIDAIDISTIIKLVNHPTLELVV